jgi:phosphate butyryltransferase
MIKSFKELEEHAAQGETRRIAVVAAHDKEVLLSLKDAVHNNIVSPVLIGNKKEIESLMKELDIRYEAEIIGTENDQESAEQAVQLVSSGKAHMLMKGLISTPVILKAVLNKEWGLRTGRLLSHIAVFMERAHHKLYILSDAAMNIAPDLDGKKQILENAVEVAHKLKNEKPRVAPICAIETVNTDMQATVDASLLSKMNDRGQIKGCVVDGPLAMDNAVNEEAAKHKGISSPVAGNADVLLVPTIEVGNAIYKTLAFFADVEFAGTIYGAGAPIVLTSRSDSYQTKYNSIVLAAALAM